MEIGKKLKEARIKAGLTQEAVSESIQVSRQTISNWENEKSYPDIVSVIRMGELYAVSLDELLKGDKEMLKHLEESTDVVASNKQLLKAVLFNILLLLFGILGVGFLPESNFILIGICLVAIASMAFLFYQVIKRI